MLSLIYFLLVGCSDHMVAKVMLEEPDILVYPEMINFGRLISGQETGLETFTVINAGDGDLVISSPVLVSGNSRYSLESEEEEYTIAGGEMQEFIVEYQPETYEANGGYIDILSNDADESLSRVLLEGYGDAPVMTVTPQDFDYGDISIGCDNEERITIRNDGNLDLTVESIVQMVTQPVDILMEMGSLPDLPWTLTPGQEIDFLVSYIPSNVGIDQSQVVIGGSDPQTPEIITTQVGTGDVEHWYSEQWQQEEIAMLDIIWVVDDSGSMAPYQQSLASNTSSFLNIFMASGADFHMGVITTTHYNFIGYVDNSTPNAASLLAQYLMVGTSGSGQEKGLEKVKSALTSGNAQPGESFFREDATLVVIFVSDEPDHSTDPFGSFTGFFDSLKPPGKFIPIGVIGDVPDGCKVGFGSVTRTADPGYGYWDLINYYNSNWYSICASDWGVQMQNIGNVISGRSSFELSEHDPIEDTIEVKVNGQISSDWSYNPSSNSVVFDHDHVPEEGQTVSIDYATWGCGGE